MYAENLKWYIIWEEWVWADKNFSVDLESSAHYIRGAPSGPAQRFCPTRHTHATSLPSAPPVIHARNHVRTEATGPFRIHAITIIWVHRSAITIHHIGIMPLQFYNSFKYTTTYPFAVFLKNFGPKYPWSSSSNPLYPSLSMASESPMASRARRASCPASVPLLS